MTKYIVLYENERKDDLPPDLLKGHVEHLRNLNSLGVLFLCGPLKDAYKGLLIIKATSLEEVKGYVLKDPFIIHKWYANYHIYEWIEGNETNNYLM